MTPEAVSSCFTRSDGTYLFARWGRPIAPVVFGVEDQTLPVIKGASEAVVTLAGHKMAEMDPELGVNLMIFFIRDWDELTATPNLDRLIPDLGPLVVRLKGADANQYRSFRFDAEGGIKAAFVFIRMDAAMSAAPAETIALRQCVQTILLWSDTAFKSAGPLAQLPDDKGAVLKPEIADIIRVAYDPVMPGFADDPSHALRLHARLTRPS